MKLVNILREAREELFVDYFKKKFLDVAQTIESVVTPNRVWGGDDVFTNLSFVLERASIEERNGHERIFFYYKILGGEYTWKCTDDIQEGPEPINTKKNRESLTDVLHEFTKHKGSYFSVTKWLSIKITN
jgi:hypothetical protein